MTRDDEPPVTRPPTAWPKVLLKVALIVAALVLGLFIAVPMVIKIGGVRRDAKRMQGTGNMCQFALAAHSYADYDGGGFLGPYAQISSGVLNTELSFRVSLLPYLEQGNIHRLIDLKQPWDSVQNAPATSVAIKNLQSPDTPDRTKPDTPYRVFYGGGALFEADGTPVKLRDIPDGLSNTILFVHATETVPWAKPQEFPYARTTPLPPLGSRGLSRDGFNAAFADGSVRFLRHTIPEADLRSLIEKADGRDVNVE